MKLIGYRDDGSEITRITFFINRSGILYKLCAVDTFWILCTITLETARRTFLLNYRTPKGERPVCPDNPVTTIKDGADNPVYTLVRKRTAYKKDRKKLFAKKTSEVDYICYDLSYRNRLIHVKASRGQHWSHDYEFTIGQQVIGSIHALPCPNDYPAREEGRAEYTVEFDESLTPAVIYILLQMPLLC